MILLSEELTHSNSKIITEASVDGKSMWFTGICMQSSIKNRNGRLYPLSEIARSVTEAQAQIKEANGIFGELEHPQNLNLNADRISHVITEMWMNGNDAYGKAKLLNTPVGLIAQELIKSGVKVGVSSRGAGNVNESGEVDGYIFKTYDIVLTPSAPNALPTAVYEALDTKVGHKVQTLAEQLRDDPSAQKYFKKEILSFIRNQLFK